MKRTVCFADKYITFSDTPHAQYDLTIDSRADTIAELSRVKVVDFFEKYNSIHFLCRTPNEAFDHFCNDFRMVQAAGGVVSNPAGESLMILRNGRWDLPKGHHEKGETIEQCALREVEEETGVAPLTLGEKICETYHAYIMRSEWVLKTTHWYSMNCTSDAPTTPQSEEGIEKAEWCSNEAVEENLKSSYPTIQSVFEAKKLQ